MKYFRYSIVDDASISGDLNSFDDDEEDFFSDDDF